MPFSITDAAFEGFRVMRRAPLAVLMWGLAYLVMLVLIVLLCGTAIFSMMQGASMVENDPASAMAAFGSLMMVYAVGIPLSMIAAAVVVAATCRAVLTPDKPGFFYMRLGGAELRLFGAYLVLTIGALAIIFAFVMVMALIFGGAAMANAGTGGAMPTAAIALIYPLIFGALILWVWLAVRLSLVAPITVAEGRFALGRSWAATKGRFWTLLDLGAATMVRWFIVYMAMVVLMMFVAMVGVSAFQPDALASMEQSPQTHWSAILPLVIAYIVFIAGFSAIQFTVISTPFAAFYRDVIAPKPAPATETAA
ncbi:hypothetical protein GGQ87_002775 [Brevundimonas alba]|uniref:Glycerophosphoryl diester phosphodiesterase membrane domain-containing protein n=1 Tax=Brevundimonas alba TaxID=74314 RepID=A0A7X5YM43_9CAUL|nr:hypothetical protein [Brevundimonas alba]NJC42480.1 hypothetical protein [Brevundimonas alba]